MIVVSGVDYIVIFALVCVIGGLIAAFVRAKRPELWRRLWIAWGLLFVVIEVAGAFNANTLSENIVASVPLPILIGATVLLAAVLSVHWWDLWRRMGKAREAKAAKGTAMQFDKAFAIDKLNEMIAQHPDVAADCGEAEIENYLDCAPFARGMIQHCNLDRDTFVKGLVCFDFEWGQQFRRLYRCPPTSNDWEASFFDRANAFADALGAPKPYDNPKQQLRSEYGDR